MIRRALLMATDGAELLLGRRQDLLPPRHLRDVGPGDFTKIGEEFLGHFRTLCDLTPSEEVLDVGCGIGRMAVPLTRYLDANGSYEGFDIVPSGVRWCRKNITKRFPHFRFQLADIHNSRYNPDGSQTASSYQFPFPDEAFDFAFLTSVFTHMLPLEVERYVEEIQRVLRPGGRLLATFFLLNQESEQLLADGLSTLDFSHDVGTHRLLDQRIPEAAVAYEEVWVRELLERYGFEIRDSIRRGSWCGRRDFLSYQDLIAANRVGGPEDAK